MKTRNLILVVLAALPLAGCATYDRGDNWGSSADPYDTTTEMRQSNPQPAASPTFRPGMNPEDPRDPHFITRPQSFQQPDR